MTGYRFGRLTVIKRINFPEEGQHQPAWECVCDCGVKVYVKSGNLLNGKTNSCGCIKAESNRDKSLLYITHGAKSRFADESSKRLYMIWVSMRKRCNNPKQANNKRNTKHIVVDGISMTYSQCSEKYGISAHTLRERIEKYGWEPDIAAKTPLKSKRMNEEVKKT